MIFYSQDPNAFPGGMGGFGALFEPFRVFYERPLTADQVQAMNQHGLGGPQGQLDLDEWYLRVVTLSNWNLGVQADQNFSAYFNDIFSQGLSEHGVRTQTVNDLSERGALMPSALIRTVHGATNSYCFGVIPFPKTLESQDQHEASVIASANVYGLNFSRAKNYQWAQGLPGNQGL